MNDLGNFFLGFAFNFLSALILVRWIYYPSTHEKRYVLTFLGFNTVIYFVLGFMASIEIGIGVGFGLFAIFTILRYRTDPIPIREMTYMFIIAALPVMNSAGTSGTIWPQLIAANAIILLTLWVLEKEWGFHYESSKRIIYEKIELIQPDRRTELLADLENRLGLKIRRIDIGKINFLRDTAELRVFFDQPVDNAWRHNDEPEMLVVTSEESNSN